MPVPVNANTGDGGAAAVASPPVTDDANDALTAGSSAAPVANAAAGAHESRAPTFCDPVTRHRGRRAQAVWSSGVAGFWTLSFCWPPKTMRSDGTLLSTVFDVQR